MISETPPSKNKSVLIKRTGMNVRRPRAGSSIEEFRSPRQMRVSLASSSAGSSPLSPRPPSLQGSSSSSPPAKFHRINSLDSDDSGDDDGGMIKGFMYYLVKRNREMMNFVRIQYKKVAVFFFWIFWPITLPFIILRSLMGDCMKMRRILILTLDCMIMQLELIAEMMESIRSAQCTIDTKFQKMGHAFTFLNIFNPVSWIGMFFYYLEQIRRSKNSGHENMDVDYRQMKNDYEEKGRYGEFLGISSNMPTGLGSGSLKIEGTEKKDDSIIIEEKENEESEPEEEKKDDWENEDKKRKVHKKNDADESNVKHSSPFPTIPENSPI